MLKKILESLPVLVLLVLLPGFTGIRQIDAPLKKDTPNIIIILTDDQGYGDVGFNGCKDIPTPNIDRIASNGVVFTNGYVSYSVCAPSRAGLMTGRYQDRFGYSRNPLYRPFDPNIGLPLSETTLPEMLQGSGYHTMAIGKWHLGAHPQYRPLKRGFDEFFGFLGGGHRYFPEDYVISNSDSARNDEESYRTRLLRNETPVDESEYLTDALSREAVSFIERNQKRPFFLYMAYNAPHTPLQAPEKYLGRFDQIKNPKRKTYAAMVSAVDDGVGRILIKLSELGMTENTIVIFLSDNGGPRNDNGSDNGPLRGGKGSLFEGGIRVPFAMQWPGQIPAHSVYARPVISLDIFATLASLAHSSAALKHPLDGVDILPFIKGEKKTAPHEFLFWRHFDRKDYAVLDQSGMKYLLLHDSSTNLYDLPVDIAEKNNIESTNESSREKLKKQLALWLDQTVPPRFYGLTQEDKYEEEKGNRQKKKE